VLRGRIEEHPDLESGVGQVHVAAPGDGAASGGGLVRPTRIGMVVDLPAPSGPRNPVTRPASAVKPTSSTAVKAPKFLVTDLMVIRVEFLPDVVGLGPSSCASFDCHV